MKKAWNTPSLTMHGTVEHITQQVSVTCPTGEKEFGIGDGFKLAGNPIKCAS